MERSSHFAKDFDSSESGFILIWREKNIQKLMTANSTLSTLCFHNLRKYSVQNILNSLIASDSIYGRIIKRPEMYILKQELPLRYYFNSLTPQFSSERLMKSTCFIFQFQEEVS